MIRQLPTAVLLLAFVASAQAAVEKYDIDPNHTYVTFRYDHFGFSKPIAEMGTVRGEHELETANQAHSSVNVSMPLAGQHTGVPKLDDHLRSADFFDAANYPDITFRSTRVEKTGDDRLKITGELSAHGITRPVVLNARVNKIGDNPMLKRPSAGFDADTTLLRSDFGVAKYAPGVSDEVHVHITLDSHLAK
jgi:polyisoprenoid-binding protein YceI